MNVSSETQPMSFIGSRLELIQVQAVPCFLIQMEEDTVILDQIISLRHPLLSASISTAGVWENNVSHKPVTQTDVMQDLPLSLSIYLS